MSRIATGAGLLFMSVFEPSFSNLVSDLVDRRRNVGDARSDVKADAVPRPVAGAGDLAWFASVDRGIATIPVEGPMFKVAPWWSDLPTTAEIGHAIEQATVRADIEQIFMPYDTPGGTVDGLDLLGERIRKAAAVKPVIAQVSGMMASAGLYAAANSTAIYSGPKDLVGSVGTRMMVYDFSKLFEKEGIKAIPIDTGEFKSAGAMGTVITERQIEDFRRITQQYFADFRAVMMSGLKLDKESFDRIATGQVWLGEDAHGLRLVHGIQRPAETLSAMRAQVEQRQTAARGLAGTRARMEAIQAAAALITP